MLSSNCLLSLTHEFQDPINESSSSDEDDLNFEFSNQLDDIIDSNMSSDPERESHFSLSESDKKELRSNYPSEIIFNEQLNSIFNISMSNRKMSDNQNQTRIDFKLKNCDDKIKKNERKKKIDKKLNNQFLQYDLANRMMLKKKFLRANFDEENLINTKVLKNKTENTPSDMLNQDYDQNNRTNDLILSPKHLTYSVVKNLDDMISNTQQKLKFSLDNKNNSVSNSLKNSLIECEEKFSEANEHDLCLGTISNEKSKQLDQTMESNLLKRRKKPSLNLEKLPIDNDQVMPDYLKKESPNKRFDTDESKIETLLDRFAREISTTRERPTGIKSANDALNEQKLSFFNETKNPNLKTAPPVLLTCNQQFNDITNVNETEIPLEKPDSILLKDSNVKPFGIENCIFIIKNIVLQNFTQIESINNPFDDNELGVKAIKICKSIHNEVKFLNFDRKIIISIFVGNLNDEPLKFGSKCLWDNEKDRQISYIFTNGLLYCILNIFYISY